MISISLANGNSNGIVANSASVSGRNGVGRRHRAARSRDARPFAERGIVAEFGDVGISRALDVREPVARFGMDVDFVSRMAFNLVRVNPQDQMAVGRCAFSFNCCSRVRSQCA